jgi:hypothetical protein
MTVAHPNHELKPKMIREAAWCRCFRFGNEEDGGTIMLWTILVVLMVLWLLGLIGGVGGGLIHLVLVLAGIILIFQLISGRRTVV